jgi:hypothetical protein
MSITIKRKQIILALISAGMILPGSASAQVRRPSGVPRALIENPVSAETQNNTCTGNRMTNGNFENPPLPATAANQYGTISNHIGWSGAWVSGFGHHTAHVFSPNDPPYGWGQTYQNAGGVAKPVSMTGNYAALFATWWQPYGSHGAWRRGMVNTLASPIHINTGNYEIKFKIARLEDLDKRNRHPDALNLDPKKLAIYGVYIPPNAPLPAAPTSLEHPADSQLFGAANTTLLGTIDLYPVQMDGNWIVKSLSFDSKFWVSPDTNAHVVNLVNSIYITPVKNHSSYGNDHTFALDDFCLVSKKRPAS